MIGQPQGLFSGMSQEDFMRLIQMLQAQHQPQGMMSSQMMLAAGPKQPSGGLVDPARMKAQGVLDERGNYIETSTQPTQLNGTYNPGKDTPAIIEFKRQQELKSREAGKKDIYYTRLKEKYPNMPESEVIKQADRKRASGAPPVY